MKRAMFGSLWFPQPFILLSCNEFLIQQHQSEWDHRSGFSSFAFQMAFTVFRRVRSLSAFIVEIDRCDVDAISRQDGLFLVDIDVVYTVFRSISLQ